MFPGVKTPYLFSRSAAVLGSSNVSTPKPRELSVISLALKPAAPEDGRTPLNRYKTQGYSQDVPPGQRNVAAARSSNLEPWAAFWRLELGISLVFGAWFLVFRVSSWLRCVAATAWPVCPGVVAGLLSAG